MTNFTMANFPVSINHASAFSYLSNDLRNTMNHIGLKFLRPISSYSFSSRKIVSFRGNYRFRLRAFQESFWLVGETRKKCVGLMMMREKAKKKRVVSVRVNRGFGFNGGGGGGNNSNTARVLGNLALAGALTYLSMTGQLGWVLDAIVSIWLVAVLLPIIGLGAFLWWAGRDIVQGSCPNCRNDFQILRSSLNDGPQLCPFCAQPFSVVGDEFVKESVGFTSDQSATFGQAFGAFSRNSKNEKTSVPVVDIEAEVKDVD